MKIAYYAKPNNKSDKTEFHIATAFLALGHEVEFVPLGQEAIGDVVLFHKDIPQFARGLKVCWYFDKIDWNDREFYIKKVLKQADLLFLTDETWALKNPHPKIRVLRQGAGFTDKGKKIVTDAQIAFTGSLYKGRYNWAESIAKRYGNKFQIFMSSFNENLNNLCASVPIFVAPKEPSDDNYWSSRVYLTWGARGFLIHPRLKGLEAEYPDGVYYDTEEEMFEKIDYFLSHEKEREEILEKNWKRTKDNFTYLHRVDSLCDILSTQLKNQNETK